MLWNWNMLLPVLSVVLYLTLRNCKQGACLRRYCADYMLEAQTDKRAKAFLVCHVHEKLRLYDRLDPNTLAWAAWARDLQQDNFLGGQDSIFARTVDLPEARRGLQSLLAKSDYAPFEAEYQRLAGKRKRKATIHWYNLFDGPDKIAELAGHLKLAGTYNVLYRYWSGAVHAMDVLDEKINEVAPGVVKIFQVGSPKEAPTITVLSLWMGFHMVEQVNSALRIVSRQVVREWYESQVHPEYSELVSALRTPRP